MKLMEEEEVCRPSPTLLIDGLLYRSGGDPEEHRKKVLKRKKKPWPHIKGAIAGRKTAAAICCVGKCVGGGGKIGGN